VNIVVNVLRCPIINEIPGSLAIWFIGYIYSRPLFLPSMPLFANSRYFKIQETTLIDASGATNHGHDAVTVRNITITIQIIV